MTAQIFIILMLVACILLAGNLLYWSKHHGKARLSTKSASSRNATGTASDSGSRQGPEDSEGNRFRFRTGHQVFGRADKTSLIFEQIHFLKEEMRDIRQEQVNLKKEGGYEDHERLLSLERQFDDLHDFVARSTKRRTQSAYRAEQLFDLREKKKEEDVIRLAEEEQEEEEKQQDMFSPNGRHLVRIGD